MLCERCKIREASIQYTEVINGVKTEHNFCAQCAKELDIGQYSAIFDGEFPLVKLLSGLLGWEEPVKKEGKFQQVVCPSCGMTYEEFVETVNNKPGFVRAMWCGGQTCEDKIKEDTTATSRCMPFEQHKLSDKCVCCGKPAKKMIYWGKAY